MADFNVFGSQDGDDFEVSGSFYTYEITLKGGAFAFNEPNTPAELEFTRKISAIPAEFTLSALDADLARADYRITAESGGFAENGADVNFSFQRVIACGAASLAVTASAIDLKIVYLLRVSSALFAQSGTPLQLRVGRKLSAATTSISMSGIAAAVKKIAPIGCDVAAYSVNAADARLDYSAYSTWEIQAKSTAVWAAA